MLHVVLAAALAVTSVACGHPAAPVSAALGWCPDAPGHVTDCGVVTRPLVDGQPELGTVDIGYALVHHNGESRTALGTLMPNPGGPGVPAISYGTDVAATTDSMLADFDMLLIDPRGTGASTPLDCGVPEREFEVGTREFQRSAVAHCAETLGPRAAGYTSAATADDFDAVRAHLGIDKVIPYGSSYGTYLMTVYAQRHPEHVQSVVLAGAYPLRFDPLQRPNAEAVDLMLRRICERSTACDGAVAVNDLRAVATRLRAAPITVDDVLVTEGEFGNLVFEGASSDVGSDPEQMTTLGRLPAALHAAAHGDDTALRGVLRDIAATDGDSDDVDDLYVTVVCNDYLTLWSPDAATAERETAYRRALAASGPLGSFSAQGFADAQHDGGDVCLRWPAAPHHVRPDEVGLHLPAVPVLVLSGDLDAITPDANGRAAAAQFPDAVFVEVPNVGHTPDSEPSGCVAGVVEEFIRTGAPGASTACLSDVPPIRVEPVT
jgi:pimeloyl-ACP methyl ester carboxylesterase